MVLDTFLLSTQTYKVRIKGKVEQSRERSSALPYTYQKGSLLTPSNTVANFTVNYGLHANKTDGEEARRQLHKNATCNLKQILAATPHKTPTVRPPAPYHENYSSQTNQTCRTLLEKQGRTHKRCTLMDPHTWPCKSRTTSTNIHLAAM